MGTTGGKEKKEMEDRKMGKGAEVRCGNDRWEVGRRIRRERMSEEETLLEGWAPWLGRRIMICVVEMVRGGHDGLKGG